jgi:hypothetical protein
MTERTRRLWRPLTADHPHKRTGYATGGTRRNQTPDLLITSVSRHCHHLHELAGSSASTVRARPATSVQPLPRLPLSLSLAPLSRHGDPSSHRALQEWSVFHRLLPLCRVRAPTFVPAAAIPPTRGNARILVQHRVAAAVGAQRTQIVVGR